MDQNTLWQLVDTSVKVGIGALIAGVSAWLMARRNNYGAGASENVRVTKRIATLESVSAEIGNITHIFAKYSALAIESVRFGNRWPQARKQELDNVNLELVAEFKKLADAESKLLMLGEKSLERTLRLYAAKISHFRRQVYVGRKDISSQEIADIKQDINKLREQFYDILSKKYDRLLTEA